MDKFYIHQLAEATQATYDQLQYHVRLFDGIKSPVLVPLDLFARASDTIRAAETLYAVLPQLDLERKITPAKPLFLMLNRHARAANKELATRVAKLPRELRDMVYIHLWTQQSHVYRYGFRNRYLKFETDPREYFLRGCRRLICKPLHHCCSSPPCSCLRYFPHFVDPNYLGVQIAREALERFKYVQNTGPYLYMQAPRMDAFVHADIFHAGITMESVLPNVHIDFGFSNRCLAVDEEPRKEAVPWLEDAGLRKKAADALRTLSIQNFTCTGSDSGDNPTRKLSMSLDGKGKCLEDQVNYMETFGPAFRELHEKGIRTCFEYENRNLGMNFILDENAWKWTATEWIERWRHRTKKQWEHSTFYGNVHIPSEAELTAQTSIWKLIARYMYRMDIDAGLSNSPV